MDLNFPKLEKKILKVWKENKIFEKSIEQRKRAPNFVFYEGPPTANAKPGIHHVLARIFKDIICRYKTMQGFRVLRKAGWDTHGLPVELEIEKKLGLKSKKEIDKYGIAKFNKKCQESVWQYKKDWERLTERIGFWLNLKNPYITYETNYIETIWWILKQIFKKGLLYQDYKVVPYCPRCGTSLSSHEVALGYEKIKEPAIYIKFQILNPEFKNTSLLVWTTTPWTLPGNVAIAINENFIYAKVKINGEYLILAKERLQPLIRQPVPFWRPVGPFEVLNLRGEIVKEFKGKDLIGLRYQPLYPLDSEVPAAAYRVISGDFVSLKEGTGLVHIAPAFGEEDMDIIKIKNEKLKIKNEPGIPILLTVDEEGKFTLDVKKWAGMFVKEADPLIIEDLKSRNLLFKEELYEHDYPFCWRCHSPLLYYAKESWFIRMTKVKKDLIKNNQKINWIPSHLKKGRFGEWLKEIKDWALSRERYWGTPAPIWQCKECKNLEVIGSLKELLAQKFSTNNYFILRHGDSLRQKKKMAMCWPEKIYCPLTDEGKIEVLKAAKVLKKKKIDLIFSSDLLRTRQTAEIIGEELGFEPKFDKRLREVNVGILNGKLINEAGRFWDREGKLSPLEYYLKRFQIAPPKGENYLEIEKRMYEFIKEIDKKYQGKNILIVSHQRPLTLFEKVIYGYDLRKFVKNILEKKEIKTGELRKIEFKNLPYNKKMELDFHRPYIDEVQFACLSCGSLMKRVPEVIDCWFDSGSMPFAQGHWPFAQNQKSKIKNQKFSPPELFPADYISEAIDQTRGWFYTLLAISTLLGFGTPYKNVISVGHVLDEKGEKMSKSKGNVVDPRYIIKKYGGDATRWYFYTINKPGDSKLFSEKDVAESLRKFIMIFWNSFIFYNTYSALKGTKQKNIGVNQRRYQRKSAALLDKWIISKLNKLILVVTNSLDKYDVTGAARSIENFVINDLSLWYIRRSRKRFQKPESKKELKEASLTLGFVLLTLSKLTAPFIPFLSEQIYQKIQNYVAGFRSVHLDEWPQVYKKLIDKNLEKKMEKVREIVASSLAERAKAGIKVRQPLQKLKVKNEKLKVNKELLELIKDEINVKEIIFDSKIKKEIELDTEITPKLKEEGIIRDVLRHIQEMRRIAGLKPRQRILVRYSGTPDLNKILEKNAKNILKEGKIKNFQFREKGKEVFDIEKTIKVDEQKLWLGIKKV